MIHNIYGINLRSCVGLRPLDSSSYRQHPYVGYSVISGAKLYRHGVLRDAGVTAPDPLPQRLQMHPAIAPDRVAVSWDGQPTHRRTPWLCV